MGMTIAQKIIKAHLVSGTMKAGQEIALRIDQTLTQDATGTMAYLEFETMGIERVRTELSVAYIDHNTLQNGFENADDHDFMSRRANRTNHIQEGYIVSSYYNYFHFLHFPFLPQYPRMLNKPLLHHFLHADIACVRLFSSGGSCI